MAGAAVTEHERITVDRHGQKAPAVPTHLGFTLTLQLAAQHGITIARWDGHRHRIYRNGTEIKDWSPWT